jgi:hypothetical protein
MVMPMMGTPVLPDRTPDLRSHCRGGPWRSRQGAGRSRGSPSNSDRALTRRLVGALSGPDDAAGPTAEPDLLCRALDEHECADDDRTDDPDIGVRARDIIEGQPSSVRTERNVVGQ